MAEYVVSSWDEFLQHNTSGDTVKFANPHEVNGEIILNGTGTQADPYIVSTYEEMLSATGALYIHQVKLIDREAKKYKYGDVYCIYDDSLTTIDFNNEQSMPSGGYTSSLDIVAQVDFNGWTLFNMAVNGAGIDFQSGTCKNVRLLNFLVNSYHNNAILDFNYGAINSIIDMVVTNNTSYTLQLFNTNQSESQSIRQSSLNIKTTVNSGEVALRGMLTDSIINFDVQSNISMGACDFTRTLCTGKISTRSSRLFSCGGDVYNSIFDVTCSNGQPTKSSWVLSSSFFNKEKCSETNMTANNLYGATTAQLKQAQWLYDRGFPIGVD